MSFNEDKDMRRYIILDHYENPKCFIKNPKKLSKDYVSSNNNSPSCIDNLTAHVKLNKNKVVDVKISGIGCAIATASTDIMAGMLINKSKKMQTSLLIIT